MFGRLFNRRRQQDAADDPLPDEVANGAAFYPEDVEDEPPIPMRTEVRPGVLVLVVLLATVVIVTVTGVWQQLPSDVLAAWPWLLIGAGGLWLLIGVITAWAHGTLGGPLLAAIGAAALLEQSGALSGSMVIGGLGLIGLGIALLLRGLTMPRAA